jgi:hypothetical protein
MFEKHYIIDFNSLQIAYAIKINEILIETNQFHSLPSGSVKVNQWIYNGNNTYEITLSVNPHFEKELEENNFRFTITEHTGADGNYVPQIIVSEEWKYHEEIKFPVTISGVFSTDITYGNWVWLDADVLSEETLDIDSLKLYIGTFHSHMATKNFTALEPLLKTKASELGLAFYIDERERLNDQQDFFTQELFGDPAWGMQPLELDSLQFRFHAEKRIVEVLMSNGKSPLRSSSLDGYTFNLELFLCHKDGQWVLCR